MKSQWVHMYIPPSPQNGARGLQTLPCLKYYYVLKLENRFTLELNAAKNTLYEKLL